MLGGDFLSQRQNSLNMCITTCGDELYGSTDRDMASLHDVRLTVKGNNEKIRKYDRYSVFIPL